MLIYQSTPAQNQCWHPGMITQANIWKDTIITYQLILPEYQTVVHQPSIYWSNPNIDSDQKPSTGVRNHGHDLCQYRYIRMWPGPECCVVCCCDTSTRSGRLNLLPNWLWGSWCCTVDHADAVTDCRYCQQAIDYICSDVTEYAQAWYRSAYGIYIPAPVSFSDRAQRYRCHITMQLVHELFDHNHIDAWSPCVVTV